METDDEEQRNRRTAPLFRRVADRVPTKWFASAFTVLFLAITASFGGLATAAEPAPVALVAGQAHVNGPFEVTVERAFLFDALSEAAAYERDGFRVLVLRVRVENVWTRPEHTSAYSSLLRSLAPSVPGAVPAGTARVDDGTLNPVLQPGVPAVVAVAWHVPEEALSGGDELAVVINDLSVRTGRFVTFGEEWHDPDPAAILTLPVGDGGEGS